VFVFFKMASGIPPAESSPVPTVLLFIVLAFTAIGYFVYHVNQQRAKFVVKSDKQKKTSKKKAKRETAASGFSIGD